MVIHWLGCGLYPVMLSTQLLPSLEPVGPKMPELLLSDALETVFHVAATQDHNSTSEGRMKGRPRKVK